MKGWRGVLLAAFCLYVGGVLQQSTAPHIAVLGGTPDFLLVILAVLGMFCSRTGGMVLGFFDGLTIGALAGANLQHYIATRTIVGLLLGWVRGLEYEPTIPSAVVATVLVTLVSQIGLMFLAPPPGIGGFLADTIRTAVYNGVLAIPVYALLKRILAPVVR